MDARTYNSSLFGRGALDPRQTLDEHEMGDSDAAYLRCTRDALARCKKNGVGKSWKTILAYIVGIALVLYIAYFLYTYYSAKQVKGRGYGAAAKMAGAAALGA